MSSFEIWKRMMRYTSPYKLWGGIALLAVVGSTALQVVIPRILGDVIDIGIARGESSYMLSAGLLVVGLGVLRGITGFLFRYYGERLSHHIAYDVRNEVYDKVQDLSFKYHDNAKVGTLITLSISDVNEMQRFYAFALIDGVVTFLLFIGISIIMLVSSPILGLLALVPMLPLAYFSRNFAMTVGPRWKEIMERMQKLGNHIQENAIGAEVVRAFAREDFEIKKFSDDNAILYDEQVALVKKWGTYIPLSTFIIALSTCLVLFFGGLMEQRGIGGVTVGMVVAFNVYVLVLSQPIRFLGFVILLITQAISSAERVFEILDAPIDIENKPDAITLEKIDGHVRFEHVNFRYDDGTPDVLHDIDFEAKPGQIVALLGPTGAGKSSLVNLIPRFYDVTSGRVTVDGVDVRDLDVSSLRDRIGIVLQKSLLFSATIRENIAYGNTEASEEAIIAAAKAANAHDFVMEFPEGYDTIVGERGVTLSGGQRQRVAIARAILIDPGIMILDDSTSSVDTKTEFQIRQALDNLMKDRTTIIIAQRLNSVQNADLILVLKDGRIVERGKHDELLAANGHYAEIYRLQLADQDRVREELIRAGQMSKPRQKYDKRATEEFRSVMRETSGD
ncbi:MAG: ABC transporter ATP-binding protein [Aggregatilineales bacterium]